MALFLPTWKLDWLPSPIRVHYFLTIAPVGSCEIGPPKSFDLLSSVQLYKTLIVDFQSWSKPYNLINVISCDMTWYILIWFDINWNMFCDVLGRWSETRWIRCNSQRVQKTNKGGEITDKKWIETRTWWFDFSIIIS